MPLWQFCAAGFVRFWFLTRQTPQIAPIGAKSPKCGSRSVDGLAADSGNSVDKFRITPCSKTLNLFSKNQHIDTMKFKAEIDVMPLKALLDPQGKAVTGSMKNLGLAEIQNVRIGKHITLEIDASSKEVASVKVDEACKKLLANQIMEFYEFSVEEVK